MWTNSASDHIGAGEILANIQRLRDDYREVLESHNDLVGANEK